MSTEKTQAVNKAKKQNGITNVRISNKTKEKVETFMASINNKSYGKKVPYDQLISLALTFITDEHVTLLQKQSMTSDDKEKYIFEQLKKEQNKVTWSEYKSLLLKGELTKFIKKLDIELWDNNLRN